MDAPRIHEKILAWYDSHKRDLPWRRSKDPYRVWISEIMLQQTRVETVIPYYERFLSNFPTLRHLAEAEMDKLLNLWAGLGYYSRARNLQAAARQVVADFGGVMPASFEDLRTLKGVGPYTAAAISSIAFDQGHAAIDGNLERVFSRLLGSRKNPKTEGRAEIQALGDTLVSLGRAGDVNQAFMDLSSGICLPKEPRCLACPLCADCVARELGIQRQIPTKKEKKPPVELRAHGLILVAERELLLARRPNGQWLAGLWDIPWWLEGEEPKIGWKSDRFSTVAQNRTITKHKIHFRVEGFVCDKKPPDKLLKSLPGSEFRWVRLDELHGINLPRPSEKALERALGDLHSET